ncbi:MAG: hypothetical protein LBE50_04285 [Gallionellaceae bacterium]|jgi:hypothetical protein|nr:hypothetical protein [Gallionellaceae bacterium]
MANVRFDLVKDTKGMVWDLLLYVPTVSVLLTMAARFWVNEDVNLAYLLLFLGSFFLIAGANRILKTRLMMLPSAPVAIEVDNAVARVALRSGAQVEIASGLKFYSDYAGRSFGLTGNDQAGRRQQFVIHKGQFPNPADFQSVTDRLRRITGG